MRERSLPALNVRTRDFRTKVDKTVRHYSQTLARQVRGFWWDARHRTADRPVFIVGCSRAGTTLVYQTFSEADELGSRHRESHDFWAELHPLASRRWESHDLTAADASFKDRAVVSRYFYTETSRRRFVDKNNQNGLAIPYLHALFPDAHFVFVKRSPGDNIHSLIVGWGKPDQFATWSAGLPADVAIENGRYKRWCFFLPMGWRNYVRATIEEVCALQYRAMNEAILESKATIPASQWTEIKYEDILRDPVAAFQQGFESAKLRFGARQRAHCENVLSRPYNAFSEIRLDKWRSTENRDRIVRVLPVVTKLAKTMGYVQADQHAPRQGAAV